MQSLFSNEGLSLISFIEISATYILTMLFFLDQRHYRKAKWMHHSGIFLLFFLWILELLSRPLATKLFATAMLVSAIVVETMVRRRRSKTS